MKKQLTYKIWVEFEQHDPSTDTYGTVGIDEVFATTDLKEARDFYDKLVKGALE